MSNESTIRIVVNGVEREASAGITLRDLLISLDLDLRRVAVELNRDIVPRESWDRQVVAGGSRLEIVQFVGGG